MKKVLSVLIILAVALSLSAPAFARHHKKSKDTAATTETGKTHMKHSKKKGATEGQKAGQQEATPAPQQ